MSRIQVRTKTKVNTKTAVAVALATLSVAGMAAGLAVTGKINLTSITADTAAPKVMAVKIMPAIVSNANMINQSATLTLTATLSDNSSGVCVMSDGCYQVQETALLLTKDDAIIKFNNFKRVSGDAKNGTYAATALLGKGSAAGNWTVKSFKVVDKAGNYKDFTAANLKALGFTDLIVTNYSNDTTAPVVKTFKIYPTQISTTAADQTVTLEIAVTDDYSGVCTLADAQDKKCANSSSPTNLLLSKPIIASSGSDVPFVKFERISGTDKNGVYKSTAILRKGSPYGDWQVHGLTVVDKAGNFAGGADYKLTIDELKKIPGASGLTIVNKK